MNKMKKTDPKKILVRNTEMPLSKTKVLIENRGENIVVTSKEEKIKSGSGVTKSQVSETNLDKIGKCKSQKLDKISDVAFCEKVTRKINFPADKAIFHDLIPLEVPTKSSPQLTAREPLPQKDKEPILADYLKAGKSKEFIYVPVVKGDKEIIRPEINNLKLYKIMQINNQ